MTMLYVMKIQQLFMLLTRQPVNEKGVVQNVEVIVEGAQLETL